MPNNIIKNSLTPPRTPYDSDLRTICYTLLFIVILRSRILTEAIVNMYNNVHHNVSYNISGFEMFCIAVEAIPLPCICSVYANMQTIVTRICSQNTYIYIYFDFKCKIVT